MLISLLNPLNYNIKSTNVLSLKYKLSGNIWSLRFASKGNDFKFWPSLFPSEIGTRRPVENQISRSLFHACCCVTIMKRIYSAKIKPTSFFVVCWRKRVPEERPPLSHDDGHVVAWWFLFGFKHILQEVAVQITFFIKTRCLFDSVCSCV